ncbi:helix-turn-helix domain-containing protein [Rhodococcus sp. MTM3W5.2]|uniref:helix-turn-helix domain-containing protein n=1 Tax=Rhodococcus sp. MTM3W5.2 TaxID=1805827 RepID=UPI00167855AD|nr:helix-turn-helix transcriptional regulator [Rhodococcus sp. MTM3W5.2]
MSEKKNPLGPTGITVAENIKRLREERRLTYVELSQTLTELGRPIATLGLSRIESGQRRVDADDLMALASALGVSPNFLLQPRGRDRDTPVEVTGTREASTVENAYYFLEGVRTLNGDNNLEFAARSLPEFLHIRREARRDSWSTPGRTWIYRAMETDGNDVKWSVTESDESVLAREDEDD